MIARAFVAVSIVVRLAAGSPTANREDAEVSSHHVAARAVPYTHAFRVVVRFVEDRVEVTELARVAMRAPASAPGLPDDDQAGVWVDLASEGGQVLYHRPLRTPNLDSLEVFEDEKTGAIRRVPTKPRAAKLDLILPDLPNAAQFTLYGPKDSLAAHAPSVPLLKIPMHELRQEAARLQGRPGGTKRDDAP